MTDSQDENNTSHVVAAAMLEEDRQESLEGLFLSISPMLL